MLILNINELSERGLYISHEMLRNLAHEISGNRPGKQWPSCFLKRYGDDLISRYITGIDLSRKRADLAWKYALFFELLSRKIDEYDVQPEDIYNMARRKTEIIHNALLSTYLWVKQYRKAMDLFERIGKSGQHKDATTYCIILKIATLKKDWDYGLSLELYRCLNVT